MSADAYQWYIPSSLFIGYTGMAYIAVARIAYESDVEDDAAFRANTIEQNSYEIAHSQELK